MNCKFYLKDNADVSRVLLRIKHLPHKPFEYYVKQVATDKAIYIPFSLWDKKAQVPLKKIPKKYQVYTANIELINKYIDKIKASIREIEMFAEANDIDLNNDYIKEQLNLKLGFKGKMKNNKPTVLQFFEQLIREMKEGIFLQDNGKVYSDSTIQIYYYTALSIKYFDLEKGKDTYFEDIEKIWYDAYVRYLMEEKEVFDEEGKLIYEKTDLSPNTIGDKYIAKLIRVMNVANTKGITTTQEQNKPYFSKPNEDVYNIALSETELKKLYNLKLDNSMDEKIRDMFLVASYTALRFSDFNKLIKSNFKRDNSGNEYIDIATKKVGKKVEIPILWEELKTILTKYNYNLPPLNDVIFNRRIKEIAKMAGVTDMEEYYKTEKGKSVLIREERYKLITSHTGRRSAITNLDKRGIPYTLIQSLSGHSSIEQLEKYIKKTKKENRELLRKEFKQSENKENI